jgi:hypothetical protein
LPGWWVYLDANHDGALEPGEHIVRTRRGGRFSFRGLAAGTYDVRLVPQSAYTTTDPIAGVFPITLAAHEHVGGILFSEQPIANATPG